jgi:photosystem II stability/assembly factor-like uncharacterized protein
MIVCIDSIFHFQLLKDGQPFQIILKFKTKKMKLAFHTLTLTLLICLFATLSAQVPVPPPPTPSKERLEAHEIRQGLLEKSLVAEVPFRSIGPTIFSGRVSDVDVSPDDPSHFFVAYASGGLWITTNNGIGFTPLFEQEAVMTLGDIAVNWTDSIIWVGTGEVNSSRSSYAGVGLYKSEDWGKSWQHIGLEETHHIGRIILHPENNQTAWVAALGHLYSPNPERGVFKTTDGGKSWSKVLFVNPDAGAVDLIMDPDDPETLYTAIWERSRRAWNFESGGAGSGIYKSTDGGESWERLNDDKSGFPNGEGVGRIGLDIVKDGEQTILYAILDNYFRRPKEEEKEKKEELLKDDFRKMTSEAFLELEDEQLENFLRKNRLPKKYSAKEVKKMVKKGKIQPVALVEYLEDANSLLFDTPVIGAEVYRSDNGGKSWAKTHEGYLDGLYNSYGYYFGQIRHAPTQPQTIYIMGVPILRSDDGGKTFKSINGDNVHADHHALWVNPDRHGHLILGNDGGINISYDNGESWNKCNSPAVGQFYAVAVDMAKPYQVYGGLQDNGVWVGPSTYRSGTRWHSSGQYPYQSIMGGDGMQVAIDTRDNRTVYTGYQFGNYYRIKNGNSEYITPRHDLGERPYRWNWQSPIHLSVHNQDILYMGAERVFRSFDRGENFSAISDDLTQGGVKGNVPYGTLSTIHESPLKFGLLYAGSDDGLIHHSPDGGNNWIRISDDLPQNFWVSRVQASQHEENRVYCALNGYRWDAFQAHIYRSEDNGTNWQRIGFDLPAEPVNVIKEDPVNPDILYVGTDHGLYISLDRGGAFMLMGKELPAVAIHDLVVHPREKELIIGTHGRSIYKADVSMVQQLKPELLKEEIHVFSPVELYYSSRWGSRSSQWRDIYEPETLFSLFVKEPGKVRLSIYSEGENLLFEKEEDMKKGIQFIKYDLSIEGKQIKAFKKEWMSVEKEDKPQLKQSENDLWYLLPGKYKVVFEKNGKTAETTLEIKTR